MSKALLEMTIEELWELFPIILKEHNPSYMNWYNSESNKLKEIFGENIKRINHIGSSAVKGLLSKPTIDILLELEQSCDIESYQYILVENGWTLMSEEKEPDIKLVYNKGYTSIGFAEKVYHLHVRYYGDWSELYFRDYLSSHEEVAKEYAELKISLFEKYKHNRDAYTEAKSNFISKYTEKAREKFKSKYI